MTILLSWTSCHNNTKFVWLYWYLAWVISHLRDFCNLPASLLPVPIPYTIRSFPLSPEQATVELTFVVPIIVCAEHVHPGQVCHHYWSVYQPPTHLPLREHRFYSLCSDFRLAWNHRVGILVAPI